MKLKIILTCLLLMVSSFSYTADMNYDTARKVYEAGKAVEASTWVNVLWGLLGIGLVGHVGLFMLDARRESKKDDKTPEDGELQLDAAQWQNMTKAEIANMTIAEIAKKLGERERLVVGRLSRHGLKCSDYDGAAWMQDKTPEDREQRLYKKYIKELIAEDQTKKSGDRGIIIRVFGERGKGDSVTSFIACHDLKGKLHENYEIYNENEYAVCFGEESQRAGFDSDINVNSLISFHRASVSGPFETTKLYQKKFLKDVAFISVWASTASKFLEDCEQYSKMKVEILWDGVDSKKDKYIVKSKVKGLNEQIVLLGYLARMKNGGWKFQQSTNMALDIKVQNCLGVPDIIRDPMSTMFQGIISSVGCADRKEAHRSYH